MCAATGSMLATSSASLVSPASSIRMLASAGLLHAWDSVLRFSDSLREDEWRDVICVAEVRRSR